MAANLNVHQLVIDRAKEEFVVALNPTLSLLILITLVLLMEGLQSIES